MTDEIERFAWRVRQHPRVTALHRSVALELVRRAAFLGMSFSIEHEELRQVARIGNRGTYFRLLRELNAWGLLSYTTQRRHKLKALNTVTLLASTAAPAAPATQLVPL